MKTLEQIKDARNRIAADLKKGGLSQGQMVLLSGMSVALQWVCDDEQGPGTMSKYTGGGADNEGG